MWAPTPRPAAHTLFRSNPHLVLSMRGSNLKPFRLTRHERRNNHGAERHVGNVWHAAAVAAVATTAVDVAVAAATGTIAFITVAVVAAVAYRICVLNGRLRSLMAALAAAPHCEIFRLQANCFAGGERAHVRVRMRACMVMRALVASVASLTFNFCGGSAHVRMRVRVCVGMVMRAPWWFPLQALHSTFVGESVARSRKKRKVPPLACSCL